MPANPKFHENAQNVLNSIKNGSVKCAIFDIDSTLFCVSPRSQAILKSFANLPHIKKSYPALSQELQDIRLTPKDWGIKSGIVRAKISAPLDFFDSARIFWNQNFFSNDYLKHDDPYAGAVDFVNSVASLGAQVYYLTGRDYERMGSGTLEILKKWNFPIESNEHLIMKENAQDKDEDYKLRAIQSRWSAPEKVVFFENEPVIVNRILEKIPNFNIVAMDSVHAGREEMPTGLPRLPMSFLA